MAKMTLLLVFVVVNFFTVSHGQSQATEGMNVLKLQHAFAKQWMFSSIS